jgi:hypothetical protein
VLQYNPEAKLRRWRWPMAIRYRPPVGNAGSLRYEGAEPVCFFEGAAHGKAKKDKKVKFYEEFFEPNT